MPETNLQTSLYETHLALGARMVPFGGWEMPVQYPTGILAEVNAVRNASGIFDVSHMGRLYVSGPGAADFLDWVLTASASTLRVGRARYCLICNESGGVIDDTIFYRLADDRFLLIPNAGNRVEVVDWFQQWADEKFSGTVSLADRTMETGLIACQGPGSAAIISGLCGETTGRLRPFAWAEASLHGASVLLGRTGYTGEDGFEVLCPAVDAPKIWDSLRESGVTPCGLGARDVLRLEAGLPLHGHEIDQNTTPLEARLERFVNLDKDFVGSEALRRQQDRGVERALVGLRLPGRSAPRAGYTLSYQGEPAGEVTSGSYSPTLDTSIGMGYVLNRFALPDTVLDLDLRGRTAQVELVPLPFYTRNRNP